MADGILAIGPSDVAVGLVKTKLLEMHFPKFRSDGKQPLYNREEQKYNYNPYEIGRIFKQLVKQAKKYAE